MERDMDSTTRSSQAKLPMTPVEIGILVKIYRETMQWSQETLAELSGLTVRTIQRVEAGQPSSLDTRRAVARGFQVPDIDVFNKPNPFPTPEELKQQKVEFDRKYIVLDARVVDGRKIRAFIMRETPGLCNCASASGGSYPLPSCSN
jgi:transcriptional regulator with XRE-family HTH domain